jgi:hypothetical protein
VLIGLLALFTCANPRTRPLLRSRVFWPAGAIAAVLAPLLLYWAIASNEDLAATLVRLREASSVAGNFAVWLRQVALLIGTQAGLIVLVSMVARYPWSKQQPAPVIVRHAIDPLARQFIFFFATMPALFATIAAVVVGSSAPVGGVAPLLLLSGMAVVVAAGDGIALVHQRSAIATWFGLLFVPPVLTVLAIAILPWIGIDLAINQPAAAIAPFFADSFQRRFGKDLPIVTGEARAAALVSLAAGRPSLFLEDTPQRSRWVSMQEITQRGAVVVWPTNDTAGQPPAAISRDFPDMVPEVPHIFDRTVQGNLSPLRIGWAVIRPQSPDAPAPAEPAKP